MQYTLKVLKLYLTDDVHFVVIQILKKAMKMGKKILVVCSDRVLLESLSIKLWSARAFLPHGMETDEYVDWNPICLIVQSNLDIEPANVIRAENILYVNIIPKMNEKILCVFDKNLWKEDMLTDQMQILSWK